MATPDPRLDPEKGTPRRGPAPHVPTPHPPHRPDARRARWAFIGLGLVVLAIAGVWLFYEPERQVELDAPEVGLTIDELTEDPSPWVGKQVTLTGEIDEVYPNDAFTLEESLGSSEVLVINDTGRPLELEKDASITVTGIARVFNREPFQQAVEYRLDEGVYAPHEGKAVIVATRVTPPFED